MVLVGTSWRMALATTKSFQLNSMYLLNNKPLKNVQRYPKISSICFQLFTALLIFRVASRWRMTRSLRRRRGRSLGNLQRSTQKRSAVTHYIGGTNVIIIKADLELLYTQAHLTSITVAMIVVVIKISSSSSSYHCCNNLLPAKTM